jgi:hypothetical protein
MDMRILHKFAFFLTPTRGLIFSCPLSYSITRMKISVLGRGAVGGVLGGLLSLSGHSVYFVPKEKGRRETGSRARPLRLILPDGWRLASPAVRPESPELLLVALGRHHLRLLKKDSFRGFGECPAVFANCDPAEPERLGFERGRVSCLLTLMEAVSLQEGEAELASAHSILIMQKGSPFASLSGDLSGFGVEARFVEDVVPYLNSFFVFQLLYLPTALCNTTLGHFLSFPEGRDLARRLLSEGLRMQERTGRRMARLPVMDPKELLDRLPGPGVFPRSTRYAGEQAHGGA